MSDQEQQIDGDEQAQVHSQTAPSTQAQTSSQSQPPQSQQQPEEQIVDNVTGVTGVAPGTSTGESAANASAPAGSDSPAGGAPTVSPASAVEGGREVSNKILYVGGLHKSVTEDNLRDLFQPAGPLQTIKLLNDKNKPGFNYAFLEFENTQRAELALHTLNGRIINNFEIKINWAFQSSTINSASNPDEPSYNIFVGDLSPEVDDETLFKAFGKFQSLLQAHVMWDMQTSRSRGYGFVTFGQQADAELALGTMNGEWINGRAIRCNWASHKQLNNNNNNNPNVNNFRNNNNRHQMHQNNRNGGQYRQYNNIPPQQLVSNGMNNMQYQGQGHLQGQIPGQIQGQIGQGPIQGQIQGQAQGQQQQQNVLPQGSAPPNGPSGPANIPVISPQSYDIVLRQTPSWQTTVYLGNIAHFTQQTDLIPLLQNFGFIVDFKFHPERGCAFVKYDSHERAALAIVQLAGFTINGRPLKCGWGKDRPPMGQFQNFARVPAPLPMYGQGRQ